MPHCTLIDLLVFFLLLRATGVALHRRLVLGRGTGCHIAAAVASPVTTAITSPVAADATQSTETSHARVARSVH
jgi:hypothetical protein